MVLTRRFSTRRCKQRLPACHGGDFHDPSTGFPTVGNPEENLMREYVARKAAVRGRYKAIYERPDSPTKPVPIYGPQHILPGMRPEAATTFDISPRNLKVIGATKALVETLEEAVGTREKTPLGRLKP